MKTRIIQNDSDGPAYVPVPRTQDEPADRTGVRGFVRRHQLVIFFVLSFAIGWCALPWGTFIAFSPLISVLLVVSVADGRSGLLRLGRRVIKWRVRGIFYAAAIVLPLVVHAITIGLNMAAGAPAPSFAQFQPWYSVLLVFGLRMVNPTDGPLGEEPGWRGFAQPQLQRRLSPLAATAVLSLVIATTAAFAQQAPGVRPQPSTAPSPPPQATPQPSTAAGPPPQAAPQPSTAASPPPQATPQPSTAASAPPPQATPQPR